MNIYEKLIQEMDDELKKLGLDYKSLQGIIKDKKELKRWYDLISDWKSERDLTHAKNFRTECPKCEKFSCFHIDNAESVKMVMEANISEESRQKCLEDLEGDDERFFCAFCMEFYECIFPKEAELKKELLKLITSCEVPKLNNNRH
jgi:hypothetical protein